MRLIDAMGNVSALDMPEDVQWRFANDAGAASSPISVRVIRSETLQRYYGTRGDSLSVLFNQSAQWSRMGVNINYPTPLSMDAIVSDSLGDIYGLTNPERPSDSSLRGRAREQDNTIQQIRINLENVYGSPVWLSTNRSVEYFPGFYNDRKPFAIVTLDELLYAINIRPSATFYPDEVWLKFDQNNPSGKDTTSVLATLQNRDDSRFRQINGITFAKEFDKLETEPLALGLLGLMFLAFIIALALSIVGLLTYASLNAQARRSEFGVLRALGLSSQRVVWSLLLEQFFVVFVAIILGAVPGYVLSENIVPTLALGATGEGVVPPYVTQTEWVAIGNFALIIAGVLLAVFITSLLLIRHMSLARTLRLGDE
jgi:hypothetical protein